MTKNLASYFLSDLSLCSTMAFKYYYISIPHIYHIFQIEVHECSGKDPGWVKLNTSEANEFSWQTQVFDTVAMFLPQVGLSTQAHKPSFH